MVATPFLSFH